MDRDTFAVILTELGLSRENTDYVGQILRGEKVPGSYIFADFSISSVYRDIELPGASKIDRERDLIVNYKVLLDAQNEQTGLILCSFCEATLTKKYGRPWFHGSVKGSNRIKKQLCDKHADRHHFKPGTEKQFKKRKRPENHSQLPFKKVATTNGLTEVANAVINFVCTAGIPIQIVNEPSFANMLAVVADNKAHQVKQVLETIGLLQHYFRKVLSFWKFLDIYWPIRNSGQSLFYGLISEILGVIWHAIWPISTLSIYICMK